MQVIAHDIESFVDHQLLEFAHGRLRHWQRATCAYDVGFGFTTESNAYRHGFKSPSWRGPCDSGRPNAYATVRWTATPAMMVRERLFDRLSRQAPVLTVEVNAEMAQVRTNLLQFEQVFSADGQTSDGVITLQVVLVANNQVLDQFRVTRSVKAQDNTAEGGSQALRVATDEAVNQIAQWIAKVR